MRIRFACLLTLAICLIAIRPIIADSPKTADWVMWGYDLANHRYNANESTLTPANVTKLAPRWEFAFPDTDIASVPPTVIGDTLYVGSWNGHIYALDVATGKERWNFFTGITGKTGSIRVAAVVSGDLVLFGDQLGRFFAVNKSNGVLAWIQQDMEKHPLAQITGSPVVYGDRVYVPMASREESAAADPAYECCTFRGSLIALNIADGSVAWKFYASDEPKPGQLSAAGIQNYGPSGVGIWSTPAIDSEAGLIYLSTGNSYSEPVSPYSDAIIAVNLKDGSLSWAKQLTEGDWANSGCLQNPPQNCEGEHGEDLDFGSAPMLWTIETANGPRKLVGAVQKSGYFHTLDALTGKIVWQRAIGETVSFPWGASYDGERIYMADTTYEKNGGVYALDPATGEVVWHLEEFPCVPGHDQSADSCWSGHMAAAATTPGVLWLGAMDGQLRAIDSATGQILWTYNTGYSATGVNGVKGRGGSIGPGGATVANGQVYVNSGYSPWGPRLLTGNLLIAFSLDQEF